MRDPKKYTRSLIVCQSTVTITYIVIGIVVYYFCGSFVASPALGSAGVTMKKICYGLALPGLLVTVTIVSPIGLSGSAVLVDVSSLHTLSRALFRSLEDLYPL